MTIYATFLSRGYFPKELPPAFSTEDFSRFARTAAGRALITSYKPPNGLTECVTYRLALPGADGLTTRPLRIPHPSAYARLAEIVSKNFRRLLAKSGVSPFSRSRPVYADSQQRALRTRTLPSNLARERAISRAGATHLLKADVSQFYPSLYTHAVGWAIDPKLRQKRYWNNTKLLGKQIDQSLMNLQGKVSHGIPIGSDLSFLLAEVVLSQVDRLLEPRQGTAYRWYDDYEVACSSRHEAETMLVRLTRLLESYKLRVNILKTKIAYLPLPAGDSWQDEILSLSRHSLTTPAGVVSYFDHALRLRAAFPDSPVLMYAMGVLFRVPKPTSGIHRVAQSYILQAVVSEPGCAQKAFALLSYWEINGVKFDRLLIARTIENLSLLHQSRGLSSDLAWALGFAIQHKVSLTKRTGAVVSRFEDDAVALEALHANALRLLPGFRAESIDNALAKETCEGEHWLALYEGVRQGFLSKCSSVVRSDAFFGSLLDAKVSFYQTRLPAYALLIHPGGAPEWVVNAWVTSLAKAAETAPPTAAPAPPSAMGVDVAKLPSAERTAMDTVRELLDKFSKRATVAPETYR